MQASTDKKVSPPAEMTLADGLLKLVNELVQIMGQEMDLVNARKTAEHAELLKRKQRLTMDYRATMKTLEAQPDMLKKLPVSRREALKAAAQKLADVAERNAQQLRAAVVATQRLVQTIISIVKDEVLPKAGYKDPRTMHMALGVYSPTCQSVAINRTV